MITRFPAEQLLVAGRHYFTVDGPLPAIRETESKPSKRVREMIEASSKTGRGSASATSKRTDGSTNKSWISGTNYLTMAISVVMPALEMAQETGKLISWLKKEGEAVAKGEPLLEIETDKAVMEIESPGEGVLAGIKVQAGAEVPVGQTIAWIVRPGETPPTDEVTATSGRKTTSAVTTSAPASSTATPPSAAAQSAARPVKISPKARRLASERGVDLADVRGSGPGGEILASDILAAAEAKSPHPPRRPTAAARLLA